MLPKVNDASAVSPVKVCGSSSGQLVAIKRDRVVRLDRLPSSAGISPVSWLLKRYRLLQIGVGSPTPSVSHHSTGWHGEPDSLGWRGCPTPSVSPRSTDWSRGASAFAGWRGCPVPSVSHHGQLVVGEEQPLPGWRGSPTPTVSPRSTGLAKRCRLERLPTRRYLPGHWLTPSQLPDWTVAPPVGISPVQLVPV